ALALARARARRLLTHMSVTNDELATSLRRAGDLRAAAGRTEQATSVLSMASQQLHTLGLDEEAARIEVTLRRLRKHD
ncbi:MAG: hypothetical protein ACI9MC_002873, partial [Kiritimatiellia bacterium]